MHNVRVKIHTHSPNMIDLKQIVCTQFDIKLQKMFKIRLNFKDQIFH